MPTPSFDPTWEREIYSKGGHMNRYPWDVVVSFLNRYRPAGPGVTRVLEVGCGAGNNLWCAAREGFDVTGIDASVSAIARARSRFEAEGLSADLRVGDFTSLPFPDDTFDMVIDRAALTYAPEPHARLAVAEIRRVLHRGGRLLFNCYGTEHSSRDGATLLAGGIHSDIQRGTLAGSGRVRFYSGAAVDALFEGWKTLSRQHVVVTESVPAKQVHAEWRVVLEKIR